VRICLGPRARSRHVLCAVARKAGPSAQGLRWRTGRLGQRLWAIHGAERGPRFGHGRNTAGRRHRLLQRPPFGLGGLPLGRDRQRFRPNRLRRTTGTTGGLNQTRTYPSRTLANTPETRAKAAAAAAAGHSYTVAPASPPFACRAATERMCGFSRITQTSNAVISNT